jgi:hypothetical protein
MNKYKVVAKDDLYAYPHTWTKGLDYEVVEKTDYFTLASNEGSVNYYNAVKNDVLANFKIIE